LAVLPITNKAASKIFNFFILFIIIVLSYVTFSQLLYRIDKAYVEE
jgi:hypothetical protein